MPLYILKPKETLIKASSATSWSLPRLFEPLFPHLSSERLRKIVSKIHRNCLRFCQASFNQRFPNFVRSVFVSLLIAGGLASSLHADVVSGFSGGLGNTSPNQFPGTAGQGWSDGWSASYWRNIKDGLSTEVKRDGAFKDAPEVLVVSRKGNEGFLRITRTLDATALDVAAPHRVTFQIRADEFTGSPEQPFVFTLGGAESNKDTSPSKTVWSLGISAKKSTWSIYHRNESGDTILHQTPVPLEFGIVYSISVHVFPDERTFQVTIDSGSHTYESPRFLSPKEGAKAESIFFSGWVVDNGGGNFRWSLGPIRIQSLDASSKP